MIKGVGIDAVSISETTRLMNASTPSGSHSLDSAFARRVFTGAERAEAAQRTRKDEFLAGRFAAKEAIYKALSPLLKDGFDLRAIEVLSRPDGSPHFNNNIDLAPILQSAGIESIHISITNEADLAICFAVAEGSE